MIAFGGAARGDTFTVANTATRAQGSLRQAIPNANGPPGVDTITFNVSGAGPTGGICRSGSALHRRRVRARFYRRLHAGGYLAPRHRPTGARTPLCDRDLGSGVSGGVRLYGLGDGRRGGASESGPFFFRSVSPRSFGAGLFHRHRRHGHDPRSDQTDEASTAPGSVGPRDSPWEVPRPPTAISSPLPGGQDIWLEKVSRWHDRRESARHRRERGGGDRPRYRTLHR